MNRSIVLVACLLSFPAVAQENPPATPDRPEQAEASASPAATAPDAPAASAPPAPVATETLDVASVRRGITQSGSSAGAVTLVAREMTVRTHVLSRDRARYNRAFSFLGADDAPILGGDCDLRTEGRSLAGFEWGRSVAQVYACTVEDRPAEEFAFEVALPAFRDDALTFRGFGVDTRKEVAPAELQAVLGARMLYRGVSYAAVPTGFDEIRGGVLAVAVPGQPRVVQGYAIQRDGVEIGRLAFDMRDAKAGRITAPVSDADGREAVLYMALQLHAMPDVYSPRVRERLMSP